ncbi:MerR family transcriptional regulator [Promicromonospora sp. Populi]|uniref:MerR family transcriptional regulator n=1 Tax=Promicromonospora sp. Populi TaxID=3239420 RepID=UPI0034E30290
MRDAGLLTSIRGSRLHFRHSTREAANTRLPRLRPVARAVVSTPVESPSSGILRDLRGRSSSRWMLRSSVKIGEASRASGVSARSLRFYEDKGLIVPGRCSNGYRDYCRSTVDRVITVRSLLESGLPVRMIKELLPDLAGGPDNNAERLCSEFLDEVQAYRDRLSTRIAALGAQQSALDTFLSAAGR